MDPPWSTSIAPDSDQGPQRRIGRSLQALVPTIQAESRVTPDLLPHSGAVGSAESGASTKVFAAAAAGQQMFEERGCVGCRRGRSYASSGIWASRLDWVSAPMGTKRLADTSSAGGSENVYNWCRLRITPCAARR